MRAHDLFDFVEIMILYVAAVLTQMHRDAVCTSQFNNAGCVRGLRVWSTSRLTQCRDMIDIDAKKYWL
jgi:hypothetical protein